MVKRSHAVARNMEARADLAQRASDLDKVWLYTRSSKGYGC